MSELLGALGGGAVGVAVGEAGATVLTPALEAPAQEAWKEAVGKGAGKVLELQQLAELVATTLNVIADVEEDAARGGYDLDALRSAIQLVLKAPGVPEAERLYLRAAGKYPGAITQAQLHHAYGKAGLEGQWWDPLTQAAQHALFTPAQLALFVVRSTVPDDGLLITKLDTEGSTITPYPVLDINVVNEALAAGVSRDRLRAMVGAVGLPASNVQMANAVYRGLANRQAFNLAILQSDTRPEYADVLFDVSREILTPGQSVETYLRGYTKTLDAMYALTDRHGMTHDDAFLLLQNSGRPLALHQIVTSIERGGQYLPTADQDPSVYAHIPDPYLTAIRESSVKPPYYDLAYANRYTYPSGFQIKSEAPALGQAQTEQLLLEIGWKPHWATVFSTAWAGGAATSRPKEETAADLAIQYEAGHLAPGDYTAALEALGYTTEAAASKKAAVDAKPYVSARTAILTKLRAGIVKGTLDPGVAVDTLKAMSPPVPDPAGLITLWQTEAQVAAATPALPTIPPA